MRCFDKVLFFYQTQLESSGVLDLRWFYELYCTNGKGVSARRSWRGVLSTQNLAIITIWIYFWLRRHFFELFVYQPCRSQIAMKRLSILAASLFLVFGQATAQTTPPPAG